MKNFLYDIRKPNLDIPIKKQVLNTFYVLLFGLILGAFSKFLDCNNAYELPDFIYFLNLDLSIFFSEITIWLFLAVLISIFSKTPIRAGINVFVFFAGMLTSYYAYTKFFAGFFPIHYIMIWVALTCISPFLAFICWYAKGDGVIALLIASITIAVFFSQAFAFGIDFSYFDIRNKGLEIVLWLIIIGIFYKNPKQTAYMLGLSFIFAYLLKFITFLPF